MTIHTFDARLEHLSGQDRLHLGVYLRRFPSHGSVPLLDEVMDDINCRGRQRALLRLRTWLVHVSIDEFERAVEAIDVPHEPGRPHRRTTRWCRGRRPRG